MTSLKESFDPRSNSIGFLRWLMAFMVIFSHAGPLGGFYGGQDLGTQWSTEQSLGGVGRRPERLAVAGPCLLVLEQLADLRQRERGPR